MVSLMANFCRLCSWCLFHTGLCGVNGSGFISVSSFCFPLYFSPGSCKQNRFNKYLFNEYEKEEKEEREKGGKNTRANNGYWQLQNEAVWIPCKLPNNVVINYTLPLGSWAHPCCFPLQYAADDVCDYKLVLGTCSVWKDGLLLLISSTPCGSIIPSQSGIYANTFWDLSKEISLPGRCVGPAVHRCVLVSWSWDIKASMHWLS